MLVVFRATSEDWATFVETLRAHSSEVEAAGCKRIEAYRNRKHPDEWIMIQDWPDKQVFDSFADRQGPDLDRAAGWLTQVEGRVDLGGGREPVSWSAGHHPKACGQARRHAPLRRRHSRGRPQDRLRLIGRPLRRVGMGSSQTFCGAFRRPVVSAPTVP